MSYMITAEIERVLGKDKRGKYGQGSAASRLADYTRRFLPLYETIPAAHTMNSSDFVYQVEQNALRKMARKEARENYCSARTGYETLAETRRANIDDWARFFYQPLMAYSSRCKKYKTKMLKERQYELVELKSPGTHREFLIREAGTRWLVEWKDLSDVNIVREYLKTHGFPKDSCYSEDDFLNEVKNGRGEIFLCVEKKMTAEFVLNLCYELIGRST